MGPDALLFDTFRVSFVSYQGFSAIIGPFDKNPFPGHFKISPLNTVSKKRGQIRGPKPNVSIS